VALVANLPYAVAATVVLRFFEILPSLAEATVMVQSEVAARMAATPGTKDYGSYSVKLQLLARPAGSFPVARGCFLPPPRVDSTVLKLVRTYSAEPALVHAAARVADAAFAQRRKTLRNSLRANLVIAPAALETALVRSGIDGGVRAETLAPEAFLALAQALGPQEYAR
jgi:16S rRNA (adenine1518-N6/adenine1519-N6)-dimethyltransferase